MGDVKPYKVLVADDFLMSRQLFENVIENSDKYTLVGSYASAAEAVEYVKNRYVDLVIMDIVMSEGINGLSASGKIKDIRPETKILLVTSMPEVSYIERARELGADSFWYKEVQEQPILEVMDRTMAGESVYPDSVPPVSLGVALSTDFSEREIQVLRELTDGSSNKEIARKLGMTERTVKMHIGSMISKTGLRSRLELAVKARTVGFVIPD